MVRPYYQAKEGLTSRDFLIDYGSSYKPQAVGFFIGVRLAKDRSPSVFLGSEKLH